MILAEIHELWCWRKTNLDFAILTKNDFAVLPKKLDFSFWWKTNEKSDFILLVEIQLFRFIGNFDFVVLVEKQCFCGYDGKTQLNDFNGIT